MTQTIPYRVMVDENEIVIRADRTVFDTIALTTLLDYLLQETDQRRMTETNGVDPLHTQLQQEVEAYKTIHPQLLAQHRGEWVAISQGQLLDHDPDEATLMTRLTEQHPDTLPLVRQVEDEVDRALSMPSFRLVA